MSKRDFSLFRHSEHHPHPAVVVPHRRAQGLQRRLSKDPGQIGHHGVEVDFIFSPDLLEKSPNSQNNFLRTFYIFISGHSDLF